MHRSASLPPTGLDWANSEYVSGIFQLASEPDMLKMNNSIKAKLVGGQIQVSGDQWPVFVYANYAYDAEDPWNGLLRSGLLVSVSTPLQCSPHYTILTYASGDLYSYPCRFTHRYEQAGSICQQVCIHS